jgi:hypothetical protein
MSSQAHIMVFTTTDKIITSEKLCSLIRSNLSCHAGKPLTQELIETISSQIVESVDYILNRSDDNL